MHRNLNLNLPMAVRGEGVYLYDAAGKEYLDASGGAAVSCLGHGHPDMVDALCDQIRSLEFAHTSYFTSRPAEDLAEKLISLAPEGFGRGKAAFVGSGSEANEVAMKLARQYHVERNDHKRHRFMARRMSYHGNSIGALGAGGHTQRRAIYEPMLIDNLLISSCYYYREGRPGESEQDYCTRLLDEFVQTIEAAGPETIAALMVEPISGATLGSLAAVPGYFKGIRAICDQYGILLIADEVMCGMGRCGDYFVSAQEGITPDIITIAKGLGAGYQPIGAAMASEKVISALYDGSGMLSNGHTYMGHSVACAAAKSVLDIMERNDLLGNVRRLGAELEAKLRTAFGDHPHVGDIRGRGLFWTLELVENRETKQPFPVEKNIAGRIKHVAQQNGLICYPSQGCINGEAGDHVLVAPPFISTSDHLTELVDKLQTSMDGVLSSFAAAA
nr:aspartate aminotransferase family protein [Sphingobium subterraneum]